MKYICLILPACLLCLYTYAQDAKITFKAPEFYPEGIAYDSAGKTFFVGSVKTGTIAKVSGSGVFTPFYTDSTLKSSFGMKLDGNNRLWVCTGDPNYSIYSTPETFRKTIRLVAIDIKNGKRLQQVDLSNLYKGEHFANDLAIDNNGNIYITDSYSPVIYKVDAAGKAVVFAESKEFKGSDIGLNGIAWFDEGFLLVVNNSTGSVLKVDIKDPAKVSRVKVPNFFPGGDGLAKLANNKLLLVQNKGVDKAFTLSSNDSWATANLTAATAATDYLQNPSTSTMVNGKLYVVNAKLNEILDPSKKPSQEFILQRLDLKPVTGDQ